MSSEIPLAIVSVIIGGLVTYGLQWLGLMRKNKILVSLEYQSPQVRFRESTNSDDYSILYQGQPVKNIVFTEIDIKNMSINDCGKFSFIITSSPSDPNEIGTLSNFFSVSSLDERVSIESDELNKAALIEIKYLNSFKKDRTEIVPLVVKSEEKLLFKINGKLPGWQIQYRDMEKSLKQCLRNLLYVMFFLTFLSLSLITIGIIGQMTNNLILQTITQNGISYLSFLFFIVLISELFIFIRYRRQNASGGFKTLWKNLQSIMKK